MTAAIAGACGKKTKLENTPVKTIVRFLLFLRRFVLEIGIMFCGLTMLLFLVAPDILALLQNYLNQKLVFFGVVEPMTGLLKIASMCAVMIMAPWISWLIAQGLKTVFGLSRRFVLGFAAAGLILFYSGALFCFFVTLPFGMNFLLGYQSEEIRPVIALSRFVSFTGFFLLGFGLVFELPLFMTVMCRLRLCSYTAFIRHRRYAVLVIAILAAMLTPTPDVVNMSLMGIPLYLLYEVGIVVARLTAVSSQKDSGHHPLDKA